MTRSQRQNSVRRFCAFFSAIPHCFCKRKKRNKHFHTIVHTILRLLKKLTNSLLHLNKIISNFKLHTKISTFQIYISLSLSLSLTRFRPIEKIKKDARSRNIIIPRERNKIGRLGEDMDRFEKNAARHTGIHRGDDFR